MEEKIIEFKDGIPGFEEYKNYVLVLNEDEENPFHKLQSVEAEELSFLVINPFLIDKNYEFKLKDNTIDALKIESEVDLAVFSIVKVPEKIQDITVNLAAPIVINSKSKLGKQIVLENSNYSIRHKLNRGEE